MTKTNARFGGMTAHMLALDPAKSLSLDPVFFRAYHYYLGLAFAFAPELEQGMRYKSARKRRHCSDGAECDFAAQVEQLKEEGERVIQEITAKDKLVGRVLRVAWDPAVTMERTRVTRVVSLATLRLVRGRHAHAALGGGAVPHHEAGTEGAGEVRQCARRLQGPRRGRRKISLAAEKVGGEQGQAPEAHAAVGGLHRHARGAGGADGRRQA